MAVLNPLKSEVKLKILNTPYISQLFGKNPQMYYQFGMKGHNGIDFGIKSGTPIYMPFDGNISLLNEGKGGYGLHIKIRSSEKKLEGVVGHLSKYDTSIFDRFQIEGNKLLVRQGELLGFSGNSGYSTGPHTHFGMRRLVKQENVDV